MATPAHVRARRPDVPGAPPDGLVGARLVAVRAMTPLEAARESFAHPLVSMPVVLEFDDGTTLYSGVVDRAGGVTAGWFMGVAAGGDPFIFLTPPERRKKRPARRAVGVFGPLEKLASKEKKTCPTCRPARP